MHRDIADGRRIRPIQVVAWLLLASSAIVAPAPVDSQPQSFAADFDERTMRVDYFHTGGPAGEIVALDRVVSDGPWAGSRTRLVDATDLGTYRFLVRDAASDRVIFSRGFSSIYAEWVTTAESRATARTFHESLRFPWPRRPVRVTLEARDEGLRFVEVWSTEVDPASRFVNRADPAPAGDLWSLLDHGAPVDKVDLLIVGEGYRDEERSKLHDDATRLVEALFAHEPFASRRTDFNVRVLHVPSPISGVHRPRAASERRTPLSAEFNIFDSERYVLTYDNRALRDAAAVAPYEFLEILVNERQYGGGGIFNFHATSSVDGPYAEYVFVHEFAHHFAGLADEYYTSDVAYETGGESHPEPWEVNVTALHDPADLKWGELVEPDTPLPTPWDKATFERRGVEFQTERARLRSARAPDADIDALFREQEVWSTQFLSEEAHAGRVGAFEGAAYESRGLYRPEADCVMFTRDPVDFCRVCQAAIEGIIDLYARP